MWIRRGERAGPQDRFLIHSSRPSDGSAGARCTSVSLFLVLGASSLSCGVKSTGRCEFHRNRTRIQVSSGCAGRATTASFNGRRALPPGEPKS